MNPPTVKEACDEFVALLRKHRMPGDVDDHLAAAFHAGALTMWTYLNAAARNVGDPRTAALVKSLDAEMEAFAGRPADWNEFP